MSPSALEILWSNTDHDVWRILVGVWKTVMTILVLSGCGRIGFGAEAIARNDAAGDGSLNDVTPYMSAVLLDQPSAYWQFEETAGAAVRDVTGNGHDGVVMGRATLGEAGVSGRGLRVAGGGPGQADGGYLSVLGPFLFLDLTPFSLECWLKPDSLNSDWRMLFSTDYWDPTLRQGYTFEYKNGDLGINRRRDSNGESADGTGVLAPNRWHHVAATFDGSMLRVYVDGSLRDARPSALRLTNDGSTPLTISDPEYTVTGVVDECAVYDAALSDAKLAAHHAAR